MVPNIYNIHAVLFEEFLWLKKLYIYRELYCIYVHGSVLLCVPSISDVNNLVMRLITKVIMTNCISTTEIQESTYVFTLLVSLMNLLRAQRTIRWKWS